MLEPNQPRPNPGRRCGERGSSATVALLGAAAAAAALLLLIGTGSDGGAGRPPSSTPGPAPERDRGAERSRPGPAPGRDAALQRRSGRERGRAASPLWRGGGYRLAVVRRGARLGVHRRPGGGRVARVGSRTELGSRTVLSVLGARGGWLRVTTEVSPRNRPLWIRADRERLRFLTTKLAVHVSLSARSLELRHGDRVEKRITVSVGADGTSTPTGRFAVTDTIVGGLDPVYGCCALALTAHQPNLPEGWIGGDRVAIHGSERPIGAADSSGCIRAADADVKALIRLLPLGTPVFVRS